MKYITLAVAALLSTASGLKINRPQGSGIKGITGTNTGPEPGNPNGARSMPAPIPGPMVREVPPPGHPACNDPFGTDLYVPYEHRPECMKPPLLPNMEHCPIDDKKMLSDGTTKAIPYPKPGGNCNPFGMWFQKSAPSSTISFAQDQIKEEPKTRWNEDHPHPGYPANYDGATDDLGKYTRKIPDHFDGPGSGDDQFMHSMYKNYAHEEATPEGKPTGKFTMNRGAALTAAREILETHLDMTGEKQQQHLDEYFDKTWKHFDVNNEGKIEVARMPGFFRYLGGNQNIPLFAQNHKNEQKKK